MVRRSTGKKIAVAPYSGAMLAIMPRSPSESMSTPGPKNSTNLPTTPMSRSILVMVSTRSVGSTPSASAPVTSTPTTSGSAMATGLPTITASASMPPTPQPSTPRPLIMGVWLSVPTQLSG